MAGLRCRAAGHAGLFLAFLLVLLPLRLWRAGLDEALWIDEIHSIMLASHEIPDLLRLAAEDATDARQCSKAAQRLAS